MAKVKTLGDLIHTYIKSMICPYCNKDIKLLKNGGLARHKNRGGFNCAGTSLYPPMNTPIGQIKKEINWSD